MNSQISALDAQNWLEINGFNDPEIKAIHTERFLDDPVNSSHMFAAMTIIANCAETPQNLDEMYFAVRDWATIMKPSNRDELFVPKRNSRILRDAMIARGEMTGEEFDEQIGNKLIELGISL